MTESEWSLYAACALIYLATSCVWWIQRPAAGVWRRFTRRFHFTPGNALFGNENGALLVLNPLPPFGATFVAEPCPVSVGRDGVLSTIALSGALGERLPRAGAQFVPWSELAEITADERDVRVRGVRFVRASSRVFARHLAQWLDALARAEPARREELVAHELARAFDTAAIRADAEHALRGTEELVFWQSALFAATFVALPAALEFERPLVPWVLLAGLALWITTAVQGWRAASRLVRERRWALAVPFFLHPFAALRARDAVLRDTLATRHPLAVARVWCEPGEFARVFEAALRDARAPHWPECPLDDERARAAEREWRAHIEAALVALAPELARDVRRVPERLAADCLAFCPRCHMQYTRLDTACASCGDRPLVVFGS